ncbi:hypothetical protein [Haloferula sp. A504]|uniref:hypothetical protein n=1 Tax=Haloferula sp. A504 TaxID=3373601 RepID=UPI0031C5FBC2|nr:hypothetical protein [Verrucomicrobiaceae bacterium E54]
MECRTTPWRIGLLLAVVLAYAGVGGFVPPPRPELFGWSLRVVLLGAGAFALTMIRLPQASWFVKLCGLAAVVMAFVLHGR